MKGRWRAALLLCLALMCTQQAAEADEVYVETSLSGASEAQRSNVLLAAQAIDGTRLDFAQSFSFNTLVGPRSEERGFSAAPNGRGIEVVGGGVAQTATTLYMGLMQRDDIEYSSIHTYNERFTADYADSGYDAVAVDYANKLDFAFNSYYEGTLAVYMWLDGDKLCCYIAQEDAYRTSDGQLVGYAQTPVALSGAQTENIALAAASIDGCRLKKGDRFSFNEMVGERSEKRGYQVAENGRGVNVSGGGVAQVASAIYLAARDAVGVEITDKHTYGDKFTGNYVINSEDAILVDYNNNVDFAFVYRGEGELTIRTYVEGNLLICEVYEK